MDIFNNREIAIGIWLLIASGFAFRNNRIRESLFTVFRTFSNIKVLTPIALMLLYIVLMVYGLHEVDLWDIGKLKNTIIWTVFVASIELFKANEIEGNPHFLKTALKDQFKIIVVLEFIVTFYTLPLIGELVLIPFATLMLLVAEYSKRKEEYAIAAKTSERILMIVGFIVVANTAYNLVLDFQSFAKISTLSDFALPIALSILFLPFLFLFSIFVFYELSFVRLRFSIKDEELRGFAKWRALLLFHFRAELLRRWTRNVANTQPDTKEKVIESMQQVITLYRREQNPPAVSAELGWSPYAATKFLQERGIVTGDYHSSWSPEEWFAQSPYFKVGDGVLPNNIAYYLDGDEQAVNRLKLVMNVNECEYANEIKEIFLEACKLLYTKALGADMPESVEKNLLSENVLQETHKDTQIIIRKEVWKANALGGYEIKFILERRAPNLLPNGANSGQV